MLFSKMFIPTVKEDPKEAEVVSHRLMLRAGFIRRLSSGIYTWLPLGLRSLKKVEQIIREEMNKKGAQEILMPAVQPKELWVESTRWDKYGKELLRFVDRNARDLCLGPTHEEVVTDLLRREVKSYKNLPVTLYQIQAKFRDEIRPRFGVMRSREFLMKDAYSFDASEGGAEKSYIDMHEAYVSIFNRCGFEFRVVEADTGQIGGSFSHEFMVLAETGEDVIISCDACGYAANLERAEVGVEKRKASDKKGLFRRIETPNQRKINEVASFLGVIPKRLLKTIIYNTNQGTIGVLIRGDREINDTKLKNLLNLEELELADEKTIEGATGGPLGFSGPIGLSIPLYADQDLTSMEDFIIGGNERDVHVVDVNVGDFPVAGFYDIKVAEAGDRCPRCENGLLLSTRGIEVGHIFKLGVKYSKAMNATFLDNEGREQFMVMGCYGIGVGRTVAAAIEQGNDENGMVLPLPIAPFEVDVLPVNTTHTESMEVAWKIYDELLAKGVDAALDDRDERPGVKFKDCDLIGIPIRVTVGERNLKEGLAEIKWRGKKDFEKVPVGEVTGRVIQYVEDAKHG